MSRSKLFKTPSPVTRKINRLYQLLVKEKSEFEQVAGHITDHSLRCTILSLAQQNNQYAAELNAYMESTGEATILLRKRKHVAVQGMEEAAAVFTDNNGVLAFCSTNERKMVVAYQRMLKESVLYEGLQKMITYQLNGIQGAFVQLKLLRSLSGGYHNAVS